MAGSTCCIGQRRLTVLNVVWAPGMVLPPHDHRMWAAIGIYAGQEDNEFFRRDGEASPPRAARNCRSPTC